VGAVIQWVAAFTLIPPVSFLFGVMSCEAHVIIPGTHCRLVYLPTERIALTECQARYPERVMHYVKLYQANPDAFAGFITATPYRRLADGAILYTLLDGHHRYLAGVICGRAVYLAMVLIAPDQLAEFGDDDSLDLALVA